MLKLFFVFVCSLYAVNAQQALWQQCGGEGYNGARNCVSGTSCIFVNQWYSQCQPGGAVATQATSAPTTAAGTAAPLANTGKWPRCQFKFGMAFDGNKDYSAADYMTMWIGSPSSTHGTNFNPYWHGEMVKSALQNKKTIAYYGYIIAFMARDEWGLKDCDVGTPSLCQKGSDYIRANRANIVAKYKHYAAETAKLTGRNEEVIFLMEPDFWQYYGDVSHQQNGVLSGTYMRQLYDDIATAVKSELPNSRFSWDISAWIGENGMRTWWDFFKTSPHIEFINTSGGQSRANIPQIKQNELSWSFMKTLTGKPIIADTGYGVAGGSTGHNNDWDNETNLNNRIKDGVIAVTQANPRGDWKNILTPLRSKAPFNKLC